MFLFSVRYLSLIYFWCLGNIMAMSMNSSLLRSSCELISCCLFQNVRAARSPSIHTGFFVRRRRRRRRRRRLFVCLSSLLWSSKAWLELRAKEREYCHKWWAGKQADLSSIHRPLSTKSTTLSSDLAELTHSLRTYRYPQQSWWIVHNQLDDNQGGGKMLFRDRQKWEAC